ncbi:hypothetical protein [Flavobacterium hydrophilum]|uniref:Uncharacterized protein n=1 Tax=Flavobacterium hydrophilum TaxID=2211445 RepID=A0A2V4CA32_9FLAO|nr:hypothetical protein [Flavobacterium hydrophilum]PXY46993.1 hypothetical protein DMB68_07555 [Flavobacterium hydrophilum]
MNKLKQITAAFLIITSLVSCSKEDGGIKDTEEKSIENKWIAENSDEFKSIEFDSNGNYIITKNKASATSKINEPEEIFVTGTYEILDTDIFLLSDFGTVKFDDSDPNHIKFSIMYKGSNTYTYELNVTKAEDFVSTPKTDLLCSHTWKFTRQMPINDTISLINFSKAGTCFTNFKILSQNSGSFAEFGKWKWKDNDETKIIITQIKSPQWIIDKDEEVELEVTKLNSVRLEIKEIYNQKAYSVAFDTTTVKINNVSSKMIKTKRN